MVIGTITGFQESILDPVPLLGENTRTEALNFKFFKGDISVEGTGTVDILYPYYQTNIKTISNVNFLYYTHISLIAKGDNFIGWYTNTGNLISKLEVLYLTEKMYVDTTGFCAKFL